MKRPSSQKERGFCRLTLGLSFAFLCAGLFLTAHDIYRMMEYKNALTSVEGCRSRAGSDQKAKSECGNIIEIPLPGRHVSFAFGVLVTISQAILSYDTLIDVLEFTEGRVRYPFFGFTVCVDLALSLLFAALPWVVFYIARWVARGFYRAPPTAAA